MSGKEDAATVILLNKSFRPFRIGQRDSETVSCLTSRLRIGFWMSLLDILLLHSRIV